MDRQEIVEKIEAVIEEATDIPCDEMEEDSALMNDLELSSLEIMTMIADLETIFKVRISENALRDFITIGDIADFIQEYSKIQ